MEAILSIDPSNDLMSQICQAYVDGRLVRADQPLYVFDCPTPDKHFGYGHSAEACFHLLKEQQ